MVPVELDATRRFVGLDEGADLDLHGLDSSFGKPVDTAVEPS